MTDKPWIEIPKGTVLYHVIEFRLADGTGPAVQLRCQNPGTTHSVLCYESNLQQFLPLVRHGLENNYDPPIVCPLDGPDGRWMHRHIGIIHAPYELPLPLTDLRWSYMWLHYQKKVAAET